MGWLGGADGQPGHHSPNFGGSVISKRTITEANGEPMPTVVRSSISHQKLVRSRQSRALRWPGLLQDWSERRCQGRARNEKEMMQEIVPGT